jgi:hypothetical protein
MKQIHSKADFPNVSTEAFADSKSIRLSINKSDRFLLNLRFRTDQKQQFQILIFPLLQKKKLLSKPCDRPIEIDLPERRS